ncbi:MAG: UDP-N-acetylmuramate dehydrogenase [Candidatus Omnitrophica bacterium]|nr:UDP-N-acetylmuramate dehydrogenase [Candidatus Omnitrophota bacterium]
MKNKCLFPSIKGGVLFNEPLWRHTTFRIGGPASVWTEPADWDSLREILRFAAEKRKKTVVLGGGSNVLFADSGFRGIVIHLCRGDFKKMRFSRREIISGAGVALSSLINACRRKGLTGLEGMTGVPGSLGGAIFMNAGYCGSVSDVLKRVTVMDKKSGRIFCINQKNIKFGYRHSNLGRYIILEAVMRLERGNIKDIESCVKNYIRLKREKQPLGCPSAGCVFKNPEGDIAAAEYIENAGLKGKKAGGAEISKKHANFIINSGNAKAKDVLRLIALVKRRVRKLYKVNLAPEIAIF